jgi:tetratricopeptide (TPR) repeat protein
LVLDVLPQDDAVVLFSTVAGESLASEPAAVLDVVELCGFLPLAIRVAAGRLRHRPLWTVSHLVDRLRDERRRLAELSSPDRGVTAAFNLSYWDLDPGQRRMFRLLGLHPGVDVDAYAAAGLAGLALTPAEELLEALLDVHLLQQRTLGRYSFHDLLRDHARAQADTDEPASERRDAVERLLDHYVHSAGTAMDQFAPHERHRRPPLPAPRTPAPEFADAAHATSWLAAERANLVAAGAHAAAGGWAAHTTRLSTILWRYLDSSGLHTDALALHGTALDAARTVGDRVGEADALNVLGIAYEQLSRYQESIEHHRYALAIYREIGHRAGEGDALNKLGIAYDMVAQYTESLDCYRQALAIRRDIGDRDGEGNTLQNLSYACRISGRYAEARGYLTDSLALHREAGNRYGEGVSLFQLGLVLKHLGEYAEALDHYATTLAISREIGDRAGEGNAHNGAGQVLHRLERHDEAIDRYRQALEIRREIGDLRMEALTLVNLGATYAAMGRYDEALEHHRRAHDQCRQIGQRLLEAEASNGLGVVSRLLARHDEALVHHRHARDIFHASGIQLGEAEALNGLGEAYVAAADPDRAVACHAEALNLVQQTGDRYEQARAHAGLASCYDLLGQPDLAKRHRQAKAEPRPAGAPWASAPVTRPTANQLSAT